MRRLIILALAVASPSRAERRLGGIVASKGIVAVLGGLRSDSLAARFPLDAERRRFRRGGGDVRNTRCAKA
jgi:hypothetical protein